MRSKSGSEGGRGRVRNYGRVSVKRVGDSVCSRGGLEGRRLDAKSD